MARAWSPTRLSLGASRRAALLGGDQALRTAYGAHGGELYGYALNSLGDAGLAEEAVQETFVKAWRSAERFDPELGSLRSWLFAIERNVIIDLSRARASRPPTAGGTFLEQVDEDDNLDRALLSWQLEEALRRLSDEHRFALVETLLHGRPSAEVADQLGLPQGTIRSRVYYGLRSLRLTLDELGWSEDV